MTTNAQDNTQINSSADQLTTEIDNQTTDELLEEKRLKSIALKAEYKELTIQGLWKNNPGLGQLLGLCPLLAVTSTVTNALGLGVATLLVLFFSNMTVSAIRELSLIHI